VDGELVRHLSRGVDGKLPPTQIGSAQAARRTAPARTRSSPRRRRSLHPARSGCPPWSLRPEPASGPPGRTPQFHTRPPSGWGRTASRRAPPDADSVRLRRTRSIGGEASSSASFPPADRLRASCSPNCSHPRKLQLHRRRQPSIYKAGWDAPKTAAVNVLRSSVAPTQSPTPPALFHFPRPRASQRAVAFRSLPPPSGPGAARPWLRRGRRHPPDRRAGSGNAALTRPRPGAPPPPPGCAFT